MRRATRWAAMILAAGLTVSLVLGRPDDPVLHGVVLDAAGQPVAGAAVELRTPRGGCLRDAAHQVAGQARTDADGRFTLPRPPGAMEFYAVASDHAPAWVAAREGAVIRLRRGAYLDVTPDHPAAAEASQGQWRYAATHVEAGGVAQLGPLPADVPLTLAVRAPGYRPDIRTLVLEDGETRSLGIVLEAGLELRGRIVPAAEGMELHAHQTGSDAAVATTGTDGSFRFTGLRAGAVRVVAISPERGLLVEDAQVGDDIELRWSR